MTLSIVIPTTKLDCVTLASLKFCPVHYQLIVSCQKGIGKARGWGAKMASGDLLVMFDDDLVLSPSIWQPILSLKSGEFMLTHVGEHLSSRVFAIHKDDYLRVGGFDESIKYVFEDGEFAFRAEQMGFTLKILSPRLLIHCEHKPRAWVGPFSLNLPFWFEWAKMYVRYGKRFHRNLFEPFMVRRDWRVAVQWWVIKTAMIFVAIIFSLMLVRK